MGPDFKRRFTQAGGRGRVELLLTTGKNIRYQQNLTSRKISIVVLGNSTWRYVLPYIDRVVVAVNAATPGSYGEVEIPFPPKKPFTRTVS